MIEDIGAGFFRAPVIAISAAAATPTAGMRPG
jgi:hypothetical protein